MSERGIALPILRPSDLENERGQLIEGVSELQAHQNQGRDDKICAEMHEDLKPKISS